MPGSLARVKRIASRVFINKRTGDRVIASIYAPRPLPKEEWACRFVIRGLPQPHRHDARGVDSLQALFEAIQGIRFFLAQSGLPITWFEGEGEAGDYGIYRSLAGFDVAMTRHLERLVQREITELVCPKVRRRRPKSQKSSSRGRARS
jgi:hypothetical protein